ncbi:MAG: glycosyltransferase family 39 protein, partial [Chloroflexi bacterium]|nr:glycosyltransferase family 39 protein [Chloroflexota bacterium]
MSKVTRLASEYGSQSALVFIVLLASALRLYNLGQGHPGLAIYSAISRNTTSSFHNWFYPSIYADGSILADKPPVFFWIQGAFIAALGPSNLALRLPAALAGIASVALLYVIVKRCHSATAALIAALMLAVMPLDVNFSRGVFLEPVTSLTILVATYFVVRAVQEKEERYYYIAAAMLGVAFMVKLWQGLLPAPAFAVLALTHRWTTWPRFARITIISAVAFLVSAFWWPTLVSLTSSAYDGVMHSDNVWDMIFGWNLRERFGGLEYGAQHRQDILWFVTGPMSLILGISLIPAALIGAVTIGLGHVATNVRLRLAVAPVDGGRRDRFWRRIGQADQLLDIGDACGGRSVGYRHSRTGRSVQRAWEALVDRGGGFLILCRHILDREGCRRLFQAYCVPQPGACGGF